MAPMPDSKHVALLLKGVDAWNRNRPDRPCLSDADLDHLDLRGIDLRHAQMWGVNFTGTDLSDAILDDAHLPHAYLVRARLINTSLQGADLGQAWVYGAAIWDIRGVPKDESWLSITPDDSRFFDKETTDLRVSGLLTAQFMYSMATRGSAGPPGAALGELIDSLARTTVLLLGRFSEERKALLNSIRGVLLKSRSLLPILFDFKKPTNRDLTETIMFLATSSRLIIADLTDPSSVPHELASLVPNLPSVPLIPIIAEGQSPYAMFEHLSRYPWVLPVHSYRSEADLLAALPELIRHAERAVARP